MDTTDRFFELAQVLAYSGELVANDIDRAADSILETIVAGGTVMACGNGGSAAHAQHLVAELVGRFMVERSGFPAITLGSDYAVATAISNDYGYDNVFARQLSAFANPGDVLVAITTSGKSPNIKAVVNAAHKRGVAVVLLTGRRHEMQLEGGDIAVCVPSDRITRVQEVHQLAIHCICERIEREAR